MYTNTNNVQKRKPGRPPGSKNKRKRKSVKIVKKDAVQGVNKNSLETAMFHLSRLVEELKSLGL